MAPPILAILRSDSSLLTRLSASVALASTCPPPCNNEDIAFGLLGITGRLLLSRALSSDLLAVPALIWTTLTPEMPWLSVEATESTRTGVPRVSSISVITRLGSRRSRRTSPISPTLMPLNWTSPPTLRPRTGPLNTIRYESFSWAELPSQTTKTSAAMSNAIEAAPTRA